MVLSKRLSLHRRVSRSPQGLLRTQKRKRNWEHSRLFIVLCSLGFSLLVFSLHKYVTVRLVCGIGLKAIP